MWIFGSQPFWLIRPGQSGNIEYPALYLEVHSVVEDSAILLICIKVSDLINDGIGDISIAGDVGFHLFARLGA